MSIKGEWIEYGKQKGYLAMPEKAAAPIPAIIVIAEITGVTEHIEEIARRFAGAGYAALAPDFYLVDGVRPEALSSQRISEVMGFMRKVGPAAWGDRAARDAELAKMPEPERVRVAETFAALGTGMAKPDTYLPPLRDAVHHMRHVNPQTKDQKVGCVGFCMGGGLSALLACEEPEISAAGVYYGMTPQPEKIEKINCPVMGFYGAKDQRVNAGIQGFADAMKKAGKFYESNIYEGAGHAFFNDDGPMYDVHAARESYAKLLSFFLKNLSD